MRNPMIAAALLLGLAGPALAQPAPTQQASAQQALAEATAARTLAQNARVAVYQGASVEAAPVPNAAPSLPVASARPSARRLAMASNQAR